MQVKIGKRHEVERNTSISMCQQLQQSASVSDDDLEYAAESAASPPREAESTNANSAAPEQSTTPLADGHGERENHTDTDPSHHMQEFVDGAY